MRLFHAYKSLQCIQRLHVLFSMRHLLLTPGKVNTGFWKCGDINLMLFHVYKISYGLVEGVICDRHLLGLKKVGFTFLVDVSAKKSCHREVPNSVFCAHNLLLLTLLTISVVSNTAACILNRIKFCGRILRGACEWS